MDQTQHPSAMPMNETDTLLPPVFSDVDQPVRVVVASDLDDEARAETGAGLVVRDEENVDVELPQIDASAVVALAVERLGDDPRERHDGFGLVVV